MIETKSLLECALEEMQKAKGSIAFSELYNRIAKDLEMTDDEKKARVGRFYTDMTLDGRFVALTDGMWDLRARHTYDKVHIDVNDVYSDVEAEDEDEEDEEEDKEYNAQVEGKPVAEEAEGGEAEEGEGNDEEKPEAINPEDLGIKGDI
jgi:DNA-directed RNA polymerase subunit delta